jgi:hypothetical protein
MGLTVSGVGAVLRLNWGNVTVSQALKGLQDLSKSANGNSPGAKAARAQLSALQHDLWLAGYYGRGAAQPDYGVLKLSDEKAFVSAAAGAASSGTDFGKYVTQQAQDAQSSGVSGGGTHIIPAQRVQQKIYSPQDIQAAVEAAVGPTGSNLAQKLIGRNFTPAQLQAIADNLNSATGAQANADAAGILAQQQADIGTSQAIYGQAPSAMSLSGQPGGLQSFLNAIKQHESGGNYSVNPGNGAYGAYGYIQSTWSALAKASGNGAYANMLPSSAPPSVQDSVAAYDASQKFKQYGDWKTVAEAWYYPAWAGNAKYQNSVPAPGAGNKQTMSQYGDQIVSYMGQNGGTGATPGTFNSKVSPVGPGLTQGRTDQGVDFSGKGSLFAVGSGTILSTHNAGWPGGGTFIALKLDHPPDAQHSVVYYAESINPAVSAGQHVNAGQIVGTATGGSTGIEIGWGDPMHLGQALSVANGTAGQKDNQGGTPEGRNFLSFIGGADISGQAQGGNKGQTTDIFQQPIIDQVPATLDPAAAATSYAENQDSPDYQANNLLRVFQQIQTSLANPNTSLNAHVRGTPVTMK